MAAIETVASAVSGDLLAAPPTQNKGQREGLASLVATALHARSVNLNELAAVASPAHTASTCAICG